jgi:phosphate starvation-inducible PhoH-like protein
MYMAKNSRSKLKADRKTTRRHIEINTLDQNDVIIDISTFSTRPRRSSASQQTHSLIKARNQAQGQYLGAIKSHQLTFGLGLAGTGKTYCATALAAEAFEQRRVRRIIFTRPAIEAGESLGFLPGKLMDKLDPYFSTFRDYLSDLLGRGVVDCALKNGRIVFEPLAFMRGKTFDDAFVILDEAQNCTHRQLKMFLTRIGENARVVVNGDTQQSDIVANSGLREAARRLSGLKGVYIHEFEACDVVRSDLVRRILEPTTSRNGRIRDTAAAAGLPLIGSEPASAHSGNRPARIVPVVSRINQTQGARPDSGNGLSGNAYGLPAGDAPRGYCNRPRHSCRCARSCSKMTRCVIR